VRVGLALTLWSTRRPKYTIGKTGEQGKNSDQACLYEAIGMWCLMLQWALDFSRTRKARRAAVAAIAPIVEGSRQRLGGISDVAWSDPYIVGFLVMLISIVARLESGKISGDALCLVQCRAWEEITATESDAMAEQLLILSADRNRDFEFGCRNAAAFSAILFGTETLHEGIGVGSLEPWANGVEDDAAMTFTQREDVALAWTQFFDAHVAS
jgi:hypothetical protein